MSLFIPHRWPYAARVDFGCARRERGVGDQGLVAAAGIAGVLATILAYLDRTADFLLRGDRRLHNMGRKEVDRAADRVVLRTGRASRSRAIRLGR